MRARFGDYTLDERSVIFKTLQDKLPRYVDRDGFYRLGSGAGCGGEERGVECYGTTVRLSLRIRGTIYTARDGEPSSIAHFAIPKIFSQQYLEDRPGHVNSNP